jgi:hypothetical protein
LIQVLLFAAVGLMPECARYLARLFHLCHSGTQIAFGCCRPLLDRLFVFCPFEAHGGHLEAGLFVNAFEAFEAKWTGSHGAGASGSPGASGGWPRPLFDPRASRAFAKRTEGTAIPMVPESVCLMPVVTPTSW